MGVYRLRRMLLLLVVLGTGCTDVAAQVMHHDLVALDPARSTAGFEVRVLWLIGVHGRFGAVSGTLDINRFRSSAVVDASINVSDLRMRSEHYAVWARSAEFFDATHYPRIHFVSSEFPTQRMRRGGSVAGKLTVRGITRPVRFRLQPADCAHPMAGDCAVRALGTIRRSDFGMRAHRGTLADKVRLELSIFVKTADSAEIAP